MEHASFRKGGCTSTVRLCTKIPSPIWIQFGDFRAYKLLDERNIPSLGRVGDPDDIIASVRVQDGKVSFADIDTSWIWE